MCQAKTAVEVLKQHRSLSKGDIIMVFEKVIEDQKVANQDIKDVKKDVGEMKLKMATVETRLEDILNMLQAKRKSLWDRIPLLKEVPTVVWFILWTIVLTICCWFGFSPDVIQYMKGM